MLMLKYLLEAVGFGLVAACVAAYFRRSRRLDETLGLALCALIPLLAGISIVIVPSGMAGVRTSRVSGTVPGTLYPGAHLRFPLVEDVALYDTREQTCRTASFTVRYRVVPRLGTLPQPADVPRVVAATIAELAPNREAAPEILRKLALHGIAVEEVRYLPVSLGVAR